MIGIDLSYTMRQMLREMQRTGGEAVKSNTNPTMAALERRGLIEHVPDAEAGKRLSFRWKLTEAGKAFK
jgi:hypothetical protein